MTKNRTRLSLLATGALLLGSISWAQQPAPAPEPPKDQPPAAAPAAPAAAPMMITDQDIKGIAAPAGDARGKGDPGGIITGTVADVVVSDPVTDKTPKAKGLTIADVVNQVGQNRVAINFVWTLITGFLVMFMQAGFAVVETGLC